MAREESEKFAVLKIINFSMFPFPSRKNPQSGALPLLSSFIIAYHLSSLLSPEHSARDLLRILYLLHIRKHLTWRNIVCVCSSYATKTPPENWRPVGTTVNLRATMQMLHAREPQDFRRGLIHWDAIRDRKTSQCTNRNVFQNLEKARYSLCSLFKGSSIILPLERWCQFFNIWSNRSFSEMFGSYSAYSHRECNGRIYVVTKGRVTAFFLKSPSRERYFPVHATEKQGVTLVRERKSHYNKGEISWRVDIIWARSLCILQARALLYWSTCSAFLSLAWTTVGFKTVQHSFEEEDKSWKCPRRFQTTHACPCFSSNLEPPRLILETTLLCLCVLHARICWHHKSGVSGRCPVGNASYANYLLCS